MIEGVLRHCTEINVNKQYVDSHGEVGTHASLAQSSP